jgi:sulfite dehydrogenase (quinone) subunit SoeC
LHPAPSIVLFTTSSGAGYGLLVFAALGGLLGLVPVTSASGLALLLPALALITVGLLSSTLHLGHPERAWRALSQWRSSWLSREGVAAVLTYLPTLALAWFWITAERLEPLLAILAAALALSTIYCTAMIYASLKPIPRWHHPLVPPVYLGLGLASGALLGLAITAWLGGGRAQALVLVGLVVLAAAWLLKWRYWRAIDSARPTLTTADAIGLGSRGTARLVEAPHTETNYILDEMGFRIARKHKARLRRHALVAGFAIPGALLLLALAIGPAAPALLTIAAALTLVGTCIERWLFFAEAQHMVMLYYGEQAV